MFFSYLPFIPSFSSFSSIGWLEQQGFEQRFVEEVVRSCQNGRSHSRWSN
jgi:hypothetical protein